MGGRTHPSSSKYNSNRNRRDKHAIRSEKGSENDDSDDEFAQREHRSSRSSSSSSGRSKKKTRRVYHSDEDSVTSNQSLPDSYRNNKENQRIAGHHNIMARSSRSSTKKAAEKAAKTDDKAKTNDKPGLTDDEKSKKLQEQELEILKLKAKLSAKPSTNRPRKTKKSKDMSPEEKQWERSVSDATKKFAWGKVKFCNSEGKLDIITGSIFDQWNLKEFEGLKDQELADARAQWVVDNRELVRLAMNNMRNYSQSQLRAVVVDRLKAGLMVPTPDQVLDCATREPEYMTDPAKQEIFDFYWNVLLSKVLGKEHWDTHVRHYHCISDVKPDSGDTKEPFVTVGTEGYLVALYHNCFDKWHMIKEQQVKGIDDKQRKDPRNKTPFIDSDAGQARFGGWTKVGRDYAIKELCPKIKDARGRDHVKQMEKDCLARLRKAHNIDDDSKQGAAKKRKVAEVVEDSDDEFDVI